MVLSKPPVFLRAIPSSEVYADQSDPQPGEEIQNIEIGDTGAFFYDLEVRLLATAHFRLDGPQLNYSESSMPKRRLRPLNFRSLSWTLRL